MMRLGTPCFEASLSLNRDAKSICSRSASAVLLEACYAVVVVCCKWSSPYLSPHPPAHRALSLAADSIGLSKFVSNCHHSSELRSATDESTEAADAGAQDSNASSLTLANKKAELMRLILGTRYRTGWRHSGFQNAWRLSEVLGACFCGEWR